MYDENGTINDILLTCINDGNGSQCGYTYQDRRDAADFEGTGTPNQYVFLNCVRNYEHCRIRSGSKPATEAEMQDAARQLMEYYVEHVAEDA